MAHAMKNATKIEKLACASPLARTPALSPDKKPKF